MLYNAATSLGLQGSCWQLVEGFGGLISSKERHRPAVSLLTHTRSCVIMPLVVWGCSGTSAQKLCGRSNFYHSSFWSNARASMHCHLHDDITSDAHCKWHCCLASKANLGLPLLVDRWWERAPGWGIFIPGRLLLTLSPPSHMLEVSFFQKIEPTVLTDSTTDFS